ncbi:unnamed protein product [Brugia timori]|uniref:Uncharacterized protein n=1 Tax=Brugia timori TaxID=42155 RepID=A0A0R3Q8J8_9BILA|nr:unnamed protein product [Brugia timori]
MKNLCEIAELGIWFQEWDIFLLNLTMHLEKAAVAIAAAFHDEKLFNAARYYEEREEEMESLVLLFLNSWRAVGAGGVMYGGVRG